MYLRTFMIIIHSGFVTAGAVFRILPAMLSYSPSPRVVGSSVPFLGVCSLSRLVWVFPFFLSCLVPNPTSFWATVLRAFFGHVIPNESFHVDCVHNVFVSVYSSYLVIPYIFMVMPCRLGDRGSTVVKVLCYKSEGRWFDPSWCHWNFSLT